MSNKRLSLEEWKKVLSPKQFRILRQNGTERPFSSEFVDFDVKKTGEFRCAGCNSLLFHSKDKFGCGGGWPAFTQPATKEIVLKNDPSGGMDRIEVRCGGCDGHLGHVFEDGPKPLNTRYCINGACLYFEEEAKNE